MNPERLMRRTDLKVGPEVASVVTLSPIITEELHGVVFGDVLGVFLDEFCEYPYAASAL